MPRVLLVPDVPGHAWHNRALGIQAYAPPGFDVDIVMQPRLTHDMPDRYDGTLVFSWPDAPVHDRRVWTFVANEGLMYEYRPGSPDYVKRTASRIKNIDTARKRIPRFRGIITINHRTVEFLKGLNPNTHLLRTGVDAEFFRPLKPISTEGPLRVGWCGKAFDDPAKWTSKGWHEVMLPLMKRFDGDGRVEFVVNRDGKLSRKEMLGWYNSIDLLLITSCSEGTPSVLLEAAACGRPFVATDVGIVVDVWQEGSNNCDQDHIPPGFVLPVWRLKDQIAKTIDKAAANLEDVLGDRGMILGRMILERLGGCAERTMRFHYHWKDLAEEWLNLIAS